MAEGVATDERVGEAEREVVPLGDRDGVTLTVALVVPDLDADVLSVCEIVGDTDAVCDVVELTDELVEGDPEGVTVGEPLRLARDVKVVETVGETLGEPEALGEGDGEVLPEGEMVAEVLGERVLVGEVVVEMLDEAECVEVMVGLVLDE